MGATSGLRAAHSSKGAAQVFVPAAWLALLATLGALVCLVALHILSPEFDPSWRMVSEYAFGRHAAVLSLMFLLWGVGSWGLAIALRSQVCGAAGKAGMIFLIVAGFGEALASVYDVRHPVGHGIAGALGILGFPVAALLLTANLSRDDFWRGAARVLRWLAHLSWISIVLLVGSLTLMTVQFAHANGGHLPDHAPKVLPAGVLPLAGWADRLIVVTYCSWVLVAAGRAIRVRR